MSVNGFAELSVEGRVATAADADWEQVRQAWNLAANPNPAAVVFAESVGDVAATLRFAAAHELRVLGQGTGHGAVAVGPVEDTIVLKTERMRGVEVDADTATARVEAGVLAIELGAAAQRAGMCTLPGSSPDVGVTGFTLGGGLGWLGRKHGFACNRVEAIELVTADGEQRRVDAETEPDLFWALRGGGGDYAIVTALHTRLLPIAEAFAGIVIYPAAVGETAIPAFRDWAADAPEDVTAVVRYLRPPPIPDVPEPLRNVPLLTIDGAVIGDAEEAEKLIAPLRGFGEPILDTFATIPTEGLNRIHMDPEQPVPGLGHSALVRELPDDAIEAFIAAAGPDAGSPLLLAELRQLRGALGRPADNAGALSHLDADYAMFALGALMAPELEGPIDAALDGLTAAMEPWAGEGGYFNFCERAGETDTIFDAPTCSRLAEVKNRWDPEGVIRSNHPCVAAA